MIASTARRVAAKLRGSSLPRSSLNFLRRELERLQEKFKKRSERIAELEKQVQEKEKELADAQKKIAEQEKQITDLERQLALRKRNSTNSSKPPSSDGLAGEQRPRGRKHKSQRKPGGQPGHPGHHRPLIPTAEVNVLKVLLPERCQHCGRKLPQKSDQVTTGEPRRHQVTEIPEINPHTTEYQCPQVVCEHCQKTTQEPLPEEVRGNFGPHLTALIAYWTVVCRVPRRLVEAMLADVWSLEMSLGSTQKAWEEVSQAVEQPCQQLQEQLPREAVLNVDETGWRSNGEKRWIWVFVAKQFVFYAVASQRSAAVLVSLLGAVFRGILCNDRWRVYLKYHSGRMQLCWAHLKRNILGIAEDTRSPSARQFCRDALAVVARLFRLWYRFRGDQQGRRRNLPRSIDVNSF
jgi:transposase